MGALAEGPDAEVTEPTAVVIQLPLAQRTCFTCSHARFPELAHGVITWCTVYEESIDSEAYAAEDCYTYEVCEDGSQPEMSGEDVP